MAKKIVFQGEPGANSHIACVERYPDWEHVACRTFEDAFAAGTFLAQVVLRRLETPEKPLMQHLSVPQDPQDLTSGS